VVCVNGTELVIRNLNVNTNSGSTIRPKYTRINNSSVADERVYVRSMIGPNPKHGPVSYVIRRNSTFKHTIKHVLPTPYSGDVSKINYNFFILSLYSLVRLAIGPRSIVTSPSPWNNEWGEACCHPRVIHLVKKLNSETRKFRCTLR